MPTLSYGPGPDQVGDLYLPDRDAAPLVCLLHGGFWRMPYGRDQCDAVASDLCARGLAVWNLEYHRMAEGESGWRGTFADIETFLDFLPSLTRSHPAIDLTRVAFVGHSAGGHLAFWAAARLGRAALPSPTATAIGLAPLLDLVAAHAAGLGRGAVEQFLGGSPTEVAERYQQASPDALLPLGVRQCVIHGDADAAVPIAQSRDYVEAARRAGDDASLIELPGVGHMEFLDPASAAHEALCRCLIAAIAPALPPYEHH